MGSVHIVSACFFFILLQNPKSVEGGLWSVDIDESPAPLPEDGPPFSAHASRDRALLPAQVCGIVGAYICTLLFTGTLLLTVGRRLRRQAQILHMGPGTEMVKPAATFGTSPISPVSQHSWYSPRRLKKKPSGQSSLRSGPTSPGLESNASFDYNVLEADKVARQQELESLYAAALEQEAKASQATISQMPVATEDARPSRSSRRPPRLLTSALTNAHLRIPSDTASPMSTKSPVRAIYPPSYPSPSYPTSPRSPAQNVTSPLTPKYPASPGTPGSHMSGSSSFRSQFGGGHGRSGKKFRKTLRNLHISAPMPKSPNDTSDSEARTPLSPRYMIDPGVPPSPPGRSEAATTPATYRTTSDDDYNVEQIDEIRELPQPAPQRRHDYQYSSSASYGAPNAATATSTSTTAANNTSSTSLGALPFRAMTHERPPTNTTYNNNINNHNNNIPLPSPGLNTTKLTYVERRRDHFNAPRTAGAATPYSPYMPFTPVTPVTPHLTSRAERKQRERQAGRKALAEEDRVLEEDELWGSAY